MMTFVVSYAELSMGVVSTPLLSLSFSLCRHLDLMMSVRRTGLIPYTLRKTDRQLAMFFNIIHY